MLEHRDLLQTIAEVAAAFAGFTGVISVFGRLGDSTDTWPHQVARSIIEASLATILFAVLPFIVDGFGAEPQTTWRISSALFLLLVVGGAAGGAQRIWGVAAGPGGSSRSRSPLYLGVTITLGTIMSLLLLANAVGISVGSPPTVYLVCLLGSLAVAGLTFLQMVIHASKS